jgi:YaaC-like Protein
VAEVESKAACWRYIRKSRHQPPGYAARGARKAVYSGAMEQAEQFFAASDTIGQEIRPILLYYGLNQALRALAAVCIPPRETWTFSSHGLSCRNLDQIGNLEDVTIEESGRGGFQMLSEICKSPRFSGKVALGDLWVATGCRPNRGTAGRSRFPGIPR